jgi:hypothetical protein
MELKSSFKEIWKFLKSDSWLALFANLIIAFVIIKFVFFPLLSFFSGTSLPLVIVESCSMYHSENLQGILSNSIYSEHNITFTDTGNWNFKNGINKGDIIFAVSPKDLKIGDVIIFNAGATNPIIHRVIQNSQTVTTKGDHNSGLLEIEKNVNKNQIVGKAVFRVPYLGWIKLIFFDFFKDPNERGFCK